MDNAYYTHVNYTISSLCTITLELSFVCEPNNIYQCVSLFSFKEKFSFFKPLVLLRTKRFLCSLLVKLINNSCFYYW